MNPSSHKNINATYLFDVFSLLDRRGIHEGGGVGGGDTTLDQSAVHGNSSNNSGPAVLPVSTSVQIGQDGYGTTSMTTSQVSGRQDRCQNITWPVSVFDIMLAYTYPWESTPR